MSKSPVTEIIGYTGSVYAGQQIIEVSAQNITKVSLELGGKAPAIVCSDANLDLAVNAIVSSKVIFSGQVCNCVERVYVRDDIYDKFVEKITAKIKQVKIADALTGVDADMSSLVSKSQVDKISEIVEFAKKIRG